MTRPESLLLISASANALSRQCVALGIRPWVMDLFADWDTAEMVGCGKGKLVRLPSFDSLLASDFDSFWSELGASPQAAIIAGGSELVTGLVDKIGTSVPIAGCSPTTLARFQDHFAILQRIASVGVKVPHSLTSEQIAEQRPSGIWLRKPKAACGGFRIRAVRPSDDGPLFAEHAEDPDDFYFQEKLNGVTYSASIVSNSEAVTQVIGVTRQLNGPIVPHLNPRGRDGAATMALETGTPRVGIGSPPFGSFGYSGSIGPLPFTWFDGLLGAGDFKTELNRFAIAIAKRLNLVGVWGIDFIIRRQALHVVDINPRITASAELFDRGLRRAFGSVLRNLLELHLLAVNEGASFPCALLEKLPLSDVSRMEGKAILFNRSKRSIEFKQTVHQKLTRQWRWPGSDLHSQCKPSGGDEFSFSDIPNLGDVIEPSRPLLTLHVSCPNLFSDLSDAVNGVRNLLTKKAADVSRLLEDV